MTVDEYLRTINNINGGELKPDDLLMLGFIDIVPDIGDLEHVGYGKVELRIENGKIIAKRVFYTKDYGDIPVEKSTSLSDDISLHCGKMGNVENLLKKTISTFEKMYSEELGDYSAQIEKFNYALDCYAEQVTNKIPNSVK